ncbi:ankyrin repeat domain-containing protein [Streptomyces sp. TRM64462]|uniref:ankyrin repeat domain-containing protein n=1 Tax=Streptomyces sp. TRM64462 TaxID=2741726 RepID=UPI0015864966|nr:ankyrin repeat domain-containing protein [Streptomyces sp. TRM64462]
MSGVMSESIFAAVAPVCGGDPAERAALVRSLIADGADTSARDGSGATPLHRAVKAPCSADDPLPSVEVIRALLECGADVHAVDDNGVTPGVWAVASNDSDPAAWAERSLEVLALLVEHGARLDGPNGFAAGGSPAHHSTAAVPLYTFLLDHGAPLDAVDARGETPLHATVRSGRPGLVRLLLERDADTTAVNGLGQTPLGIALRLPENSVEQRQARHETVSLLRAADAPAHVRYPLVGGGPLPIDMGAVRRAAAVMCAKRAAACEAAGVPDDSGRLARLVEPDLASYQDLASELRHHCDPDLLPSVPRLCAAALGDTGTTRTLTGDHHVDMPFFHHGDLVVKGALDVVAPFVVTGSLTVEGVLADCGPDSVVAIGGGVTARGVFTDGEMYVGGDIEAEVVHGYDNDHTLQAGTIRARLVIEDEHETIASVRADLHFDTFGYQQGYGDGVQEQLRELLVDEVFAADEDEDDEEMFDYGLLQARLGEGLPVFRPHPAPRTG